MREKRAEFEKCGVRLRCIVQGSGEEAARFCGRYGLEEMCVPDPEKESYRRMGLGRTSWRKILFASDALRQRRTEARQAGCSNNLRGAFQKHSDVLQLPGAALMARGGKILWFDRGAHSGDLPGVEELLRVMERRLSS